MNYTLNLTKSEHVSRIAQLAVDEILLHTTAFSKVGRLETKQIPTIAKELENSGKEVVLVWDLLCKDREIKDLGKVLESIIGAIKSVRFLDPGVGFFLKQNFPELDLQISLEKGPNNYPGIAGWCELFAPNLSKVVLSNQIPIGQIESFRKKIPVAVEIQAVGRLEIFYSARPLVRNQLQIDQAEKISENIELTVASEDRPTQFSAILENRHGTFMYNDKDLFTLDSLDTIEAAGVDSVTIDLYQDSLLDLWEEYFQKEGWIEQLKAMWPKKTGRGFFRANKSHIPFKRLTNRYLQEEKEERVGTVLESVKKVHTLVEIYQPIQLPTEIIFCTPEGRQVSSDQKELVNLKGELFQESIPPGLYRLPWVKYAVPATILKLRKED